MTEMSPIGVLFRDKVIFVFFAGGDGGGEEGNVAYAYTQKTPYFHAFFDKDHLLSFSAKRKNIIFSGKNKYHLCRYHKKDRVQA